MFKNAILKKTSGPQCEAVVKPSHHNTSCNCSRLNYISLPCADLTGKTFKFLVVTPLRKRLPGRSKRRWVELKLNSGSGIKPRGTEHSGYTTSYISLVNNLCLCYGMDDPGFESGTDNRLTCPQNVQTGSHVNSAPFSMCNSGAFWG